MEALDLIIGILRNKYVQMGLILCFVAFVFFSIYEIICIHEKQRIEHKQLVEQQVTLDKINDANIVTMKAFTTQEYDISKTINQNIIEIHIIEAKQPLDKNGCSYNQSIPVDIRNKLMEDLNGHN